jgi:hypothetical protein
VIKSGFVEFDLAELPESVTVGELLVSGKLPYADRPRGAAWTLDTETKLMTITFVYPAAQEERPEVASFKEAPGITLLLGENSGRLLRAEIDLSSVPHSQQDALAALEKQMRNELVHLRAHTMTAGRVLNYQAAEMGLFKPTREPNRPPPSWMTAALESLRATQKSAG